MLRASVAFLSSWIGTTAATLLNLVYWVLWLGTGYLLFLLAEAS